MYRFLFADSHLKAIPMKFGQNLLCALGEQNVYVVSRGPRIAHQRKRSKGSPQKHNLKTRESLIWTIFVHCCQENFCVKLFQNWTSGLDVVKMNMFHVKYLSSTSFGFLQEDFLSIYFNIRKINDPLVGANFDHRVFMWTNLIKIY
jgi:hypothetical protein